MIKRINNAKSYIFEKPNNKANKLLIRLIKEMREWRYKLLILGIKKGHLYRSCRHSKMIRWCYGQFYSYKFENIDKMEKFLEKCKMSNWDKKKQKCV